MDIGSQSHEPSLPWYRYGMVWMVILLPLMVVAASSVTVYIAHQNAPVITTPAASQHK